MSRVGKKAVPVPEGVEVDVSNGDVRAEGPKGKLLWRHPATIVVSYDRGERLITVSRQNDEGRERALHGLTRALIANMVEGVSKGFEKRLEIYGTGYGCRVKGEVLEVQVGLSRPVEFPIPEGLTVHVDVPQTRGNDVPARLRVEGADKQLVGDFAAEVRQARPPEPYKAKGVRYAGEVVRRKPGKALATTGAR